MLLGQIIRISLEKQWQNRCKYIGFGFRAKPTFFQRSTISTKQFVYCFQCLKLMWPLDYNVIMNFNIQLQQYHIVLPITI
jgi:hypothetical protein